MDFEDHREVFGAAPEASDQDDHSRTILHFDIDCFYAQVEMIKDPTLKEKPLGIQQKNIVVTCNYNARERGVIKCSYINDAMKVCPDLVLVNGEDLAEYRKYSQQVFQLLREIGKGICPVERLGMDENFVDVTNLVKERIYENEVVGHIYGTVPDDTENDRCIVRQNCFCVAALKIGSKIASEIRAKIFEATGLTSSAGISYNKVLAKLVGSKNKPNKQTTLFPTGTRELMFSLKSARSIPGIGSSTFKAIKGTKDDLKIDEVLGMDVGEIASALGGDFDIAKQIRNLCMGVDPTPVKNSSEKPLSIGLEDRFKPLIDKSQVEEKMSWMLDRLSMLLHQDSRSPQVMKITMRDLLKDEATGVKQRFHKESRQTKINPRLFKVLKSSQDLGQNKGEVMKIAMGLLEKMVNLGKPLKLTLLGISVTDFLVVGKHSISSFFQGQKKQGHKSDGKIEQPEAKKPKLDLIPSDWDPEVFASLPDDLKRELLNNSQTHHSTSINMVKKPTPSKSRNNSISNYFTKK